MSALVVSNLLLWAAVVGLSLVVLALLRQVGLLHERVAPAGALVGGETPRVGESGPVLEVETLDGRALRVGGSGDDVRSTLLFFVSPTCPVCKTLLPVARRMRDAEPGAIALVLASDGPHSEHERFVRDRGLDGETYVLSSALGRAYQIGRLPHAVLLDAGGVVRARGLVNTREHLESLFEARDQGVASIQEYRAARESAGKAT